MIGEGILEACTVVCCAGVSWLEVGRCEMMLTCMWRGAFPTFWDWLH